MHRTLFRSLPLLALLSLSACAAETTSRTAASASEQIAAAPAVQTFTSDANGFDTHSFWLDTGSEVVVFDAQFTPAFATQVIAQIRATTASPIAWVVITHPNPDKFQGASVFQAAGAKVIASKHTADAIPGVHAYKKHYFTQVAKMFTEETYPALPVIDQTFEGTTKLPLAGDAAIELRELASPGVSSTQTVAYARREKALFVGDLVHHRAHAWLEGGIVAGAPVPDLAGWKSDLAELASTYPTDTTVYGGRGEAASLGEAVAEQTAYLDGMHALVATELATLEQPATTLAGPQAADVYARIEARATKAYPNYALPYMITYGVYGLALQVAAAR